MSKEVLAEVSRGARQRGIRLLMLQPQSTLTNRRGLSRLLYPRTTAYDKALLASVAVAGHVHDKRYCREATKMI